MNKELLQKRLSEIEKAIEQSMANLNLLIGSKQEVLHWMSQLENTPTSSFEAYSD